jgi:5'-nucleotidase
VSDWHAQLDPIAISGTGEVGGAAVIAAYWQADRAKNQNSIALTGGDSIGASPALSAFAEEEPAIKALNLMGLDVNTFGNHDFDRGTAHLQKMIDLAKYQYVSANLKNVDANLKKVKPFTILTVADVKVAVIGVTNPEAPTLVFPGRFGSIEVTDPVAAAIKARDDARAAGATVFIAVGHLGVTGKDTSGAATGPLIDFAKKVSGFDVIFGDHTDVQFSGTINGALVVENKSKGVTYARTKLLVGPDRKVISASTEFVTPVAKDVTPDPAVVSMLVPYRTALSASLDRVIGTATETLPRGSNVERHREVAIGNLVADALRLRYNTQIALTNGGGIRAPLPSSYAPANKSLRRPATGYASGPPFDLTAGDILTVLPFGNYAVTRTITGSQLYAMLENGVSKIGADGTGTDGRFPQVSGFKFSFDSREPVGSRVKSVELLNGTPISKDATIYTATVNDFMNNGGDGYTMLTDSQGVSREVMFDVVLEYVKGVGTVAPKIEGRITNLATVK